MDIKEGDIVEIGCAAGWYEVASVDNLYKKIIVSHPPFWEKTIIDSNSVVKVYRLIIDSE